MRIESRPRSALPADLALSTLLGVALSLSFVHTSAWGLALACVGGLAWQVSRGGALRAAALGAAFGTAWLAAGIWWLYISMHRYGGIAAFPAALAVAALSVALSLYLAAAMAIFVRRRTGRAVADALVFAAVWLAAELARGVLFTGFPWLASGYAQVDSPLAALAPWIGVYGIGFVAAALAALPALARGARRLGALAACAAVIAAAPLAAHDFTASAGRLGVTLIQTNVAQDEKFAADRMPEALAWLEMALAQAPGPLVVAPETAIPLLPDQLGDEAWRRITTPFRDGPKGALIGLPLGSYEAGYTNSVAGLSPNEARDEGRDAQRPFYRYDKQHLVPFGEFIPTGFRWFTDAMNIPLGDFARGPLVPPSFGFAGQRVAPNVCYEDLFGEELARRFGDVALAPTVLANVSNIGWFGDTAAIEQHLNISRMRSLELQRPMLRATNTGATAAIDHRGVVIARLPSFTRGTLQAEVEGRQGLTPYARLASALGLWPWLGAAVIVLVFAAVGRTGKVK